MPLVVWFEEVTRPQRVFYYVLLVNVPEDIKFQHGDMSNTKERSGTLFPVAEMITADHSIASTKNKDFQDAFSVLSNTDEYPYDDQEIPAATYSLDLSQYEESGKSAIYHEFLDIANELQQGLIEDTCEARNEFFNPKYLSTFIRKHVPYIPIFTPVMLSARGIPYRQSNASVECSFSQVKNYIQMGPQAEKCSRFVKNIRENVIEPRLKTITLKIQSHHSYKKRAYSRKCLDATDKWKRKKAR
ncbi:hypothetical protein WDU94_005643 [Cyamophila willieti]